MTATEHELRGLLLLGLDGDGPAYHQFLHRITPLLRGYFRHRLNKLSESAIKVGVHRGIKALARAWKESI